MKNYIRWPKTTQEIREAVGQVHDNKQEEIKVRFRRKRHNLPSVVVTTTQHTWKKHRYCQYHNFGE